jgi:predicted nucleic acid-binding protein
VRIYLDACCLNRPFDDQSQLRIHLESEAVLAIIDRVEDGRWTLLSSSALDFELAQIPDPQRRIRVQKVLSAARERIAVGAAESARAKHLRETYGLRALDALHLACAKSLLAEAFLTTDDGLLTATRRMAIGEFSFAIANPVTWLTELLARE